VAVHNRSALAEAIVVVLGGRRPISHLPYQLTEGARVPSGLLLI
jgi:hypothetical protein